MSGTLQVTNMCTILYSKFVFKIPRKFVFKNQIVNIQICVQYYNTFQENKNGQRLIRETLTKVNVQLLKNEYLFCFMYMCSELYIDIYSGNIKYMKFGVVILNI